MLDLTTERVLLPITSKNNHIDTLTKRLAKFSYQLPLFLRLQHIDSLFVIQKVTPCLDQKLRTYFVVTFAFLEN